MHSAFPSTERWQHIYYVTWWWALPISGDSLAGEPGSFNTVQDSHHPVNPSWESYCWRNIGEPDKANEERFKGTRMNVEHLGSSPISDRTVQFPHLAWIFWGYKNSQAGYDLITLEQMCMYRRGSGLVSCRIRKRNPDRLEVMDKPTLVMQPARGPLRLLQGRALSHIAIHDREWWGGNTCKQAFVEGEASGCCGWSYSQGASPDDQGREWLAVEGEDFFQN